MADLVSGVRTNKLAELPVMLEKAFNLMETMIRQFEKRENLLAMYELRTRETICYEDLDFETDL